jgi:NTE family protein
MSASSSARKKPIENVLVMQGGGSLGAFACGVYKGLAKRNVQIDIIAGTSIGAVNAAIIVGSKNDHPEKVLEEFWLEIAESTPTIIPDLFTLGYDTNSHAYVPKKISSASANAAFFGVPKMFVPRWSWLWSSAWPSGSSADTIGSGMGESANHNNRLKAEWLYPTNWTYFYDHSPLAKTLDKYVDYKKLNMAAKEEELPSVLRLIITAVDVLSGRPLIFDNTKTIIEAKHILASSGYPVYGFPWVRIPNNGNNIYAWDGSLLSNTPIREVLFVSPKTNKNILIVENYPQQIDRHPSNVSEVANRAKDILFSDKDMHNIKMSKLVTRHIQLIERLYHTFDTYVDKSKLHATEIEEIESEYHNLIHRYGAQILSVTRIIRREMESPTILKNADFSVEAIKKLIAEGERKAIERIDAIKNRKKAGL